MLLSVFLISFFIFTRCFAHIKQLDEMIRVITKVNERHFQNYGCWCYQKKFIFTPADPIDKLDNCCYLHYVCQKKHLDCNPDNLFYNYKFINAHKEIMCNDDYQTCENKLCKCDNELVICLNERKRSFKSSNKNLNILYRIWKCLI